MKDEEKLGRAERRRLKKETKRKNKKPNPQVEKLTRAQRRALVKDKDLLKELLKIIRKYFPNLTTMFSNLTDQRNKNYITYNMRTIVTTRLMALLCGITSMNEMQITLDKEDTISNLSTICNQNIKEIPNWQTIQDVFEELSIKEIEDIRKYMITALIRSKMFDRYKHKGYFQILVDATGLTSLDYNLNGTCLSRTYDGKTKYFIYVLEAKLVVGNIVISLDTEWIENTKLNNENEKQDCEVKGFKRMACRIKKNYPKMKFIITGDALYATTPMIDLCKENNWHYIFNLKKDRLKNVYDTFTDNINYLNETDNLNYYLSTNIEFNGNLLNVFKYIESKHGKDTTFHYISDLNISNNNIEKIVSMGRARWKIENEGFNDQKNTTFNISHLCSRNQNAMKIHYYFIQMAHVIRQLLERGSILLKDMRTRTKKEVSNAITHSLTSNTSDLNILETNFQLRFDT